MFIGKRLTSNSTIGIISPAGYTDRDIIDESISNFIDLGFKVKYSDSLYEKHEYLAGTDQSRANELINMFKDPSIDGIICFRGGYGSIRLIPYLDLKAIKNNPKFFCGYSDITVLLNYFAKNGIPTFHGPVIKSDFKKDTTTASILKHFMYNPSKGYIYDFRNNFILNNRDMSGILRGGNLSMICSILGTPYEIDLTNSILLLEEVNEAPYALDRMLSQLLLCKTIKRCKGILLGHITNCDSDKLEVSSLNLILNKLSKLNIPIITNCNFGHDYPNITFPIGVKAHYSSKSQKLIITSNALS